jgi:hypothetical protein
MNMDSKTEICNTCKMEKVKSEAARKAFQWHDLQAKTLCCTGWKSMHKCET